MGEGCFCVLVFIACMNCASSPCRTTCDFIHRYLKKAEVEVGEARKSAKVLWVNYLSNSSYLVTPCQLLLLGPRWHEIPKLRATL